MTVGPFPLAAPLPARVSGLASSRASVPSPAGASAPGRPLRVGALVLAVAAHAAVLAGLARPSQPLPLPQPQPRPVLLVALPQPGGEQPSAARLIDSPTWTQDAVADRLPRALRPPPATTRPTPDAPGRLRPAPASTPAPAPERSAAAADAGPDRALAEPMKADGVPVALAAAPARTGWPVQVSRLSGAGLPPAHVTDIGAASTGRLDWDDGGTDGWRIRLDAGALGELAADGRWTAEGPVTRRFTDHAGARELPGGDARVDPLIATLLMGMAIRGTPSLTRPDTVIELPAAGGGRLRYRVVGAEQIAIAGADREALRLSRIDPPAGPGSTVRELWLETAYAWLPLRFDLESADAVWRVEAVADLPR